MSFPANAPEVTQVAVGAEHQLALMNNSSVWGWGVSAMGELGVGGGGAPAAIAGVGPATQVGASNGCSCAVLTSGGVTCWGAANAGCLGVQPATPSILPPYPMLPPGSGAAQIKVGSYGTPTCARLGGQVSCWDATLAPTLLAGIADATDIAVGRQFVFVQSASKGILWSTHGASGWAQPVAYVAASGVTTMAAGNAFVGLTSSGGVAWASLEGLTAPPAILTSLSLQNVSHPVVEIASGYGYPYANSLDLMCLRTSAATNNVYCWGDDGEGALGAGLPEDALTATAVPGTAGATWLDTSEGATATINAGSVQMWGTALGLYFQTAPSPMTITTIGTTTLGANNLDVRIGGADNAAYVMKTGAPAPPLLFQQDLPASGRLSGSDLADVRSVTEFDVGLTTSGSVMVWAAKAGSNASGILGNGTTTATAGQISSPLPGVRATAIAAYGDDFAFAPAHVCVIANGVVSCWGGNESGEIGDGTTVMRTSPTSVPLGKTATSIAVGRNFSCASLTDDSVWCWGANDVGQLGANAFASSTSPIQIVGLSAIGVTAHERHACAWAATGAPVCWGLNTDGQLGNGTRVNAAAPVTVKGLTGDVVQVSAGAAHTCARYAADHSIACWGSSFSGQLGTGVTGYFTTPQPVVGL